MRGLCLLAILLAVPTAAAAVTITDVEGPAVTMADRPFELRAQLANDEARERSVYLFAALYEGEGGSCGASTDARYRGFTHLVQEPVRIPARGTLAYPPEGERWLHRYDAERVPASPAAWELCVFVAEARPGPAIEYEDFESMPLSVRSRNQAPTVSFMHEPERPRATEDVRFVATGADVEGDALTFRWDFGHLNATGRAVGAGEAVSHFFYPEGDHVVTVVASDGLDETRLERTVRVLAEDAAPVISTVGGGDRVPMPWWIPLLAAAFVARRR